MKTSDNKVEKLGCGVFTIKLPKNKKTGTFSFSVSIGAEYISDYEIISYKPDAEENKAHIQAFIDKYITKPYYLKDEPIVGVELNFNKEFYVPEKIEKVDDILAELAGLEKALKDLEGGLKL